MMIERPSQMLIIGTLFISLVSVSVQLVDTITISDR